MRRVLLAALLLAGCDQMRIQARDDAYGRTALFADGKVIQAPPDGALAQEDAAPPPRPPMTLALLARGQARYRIACAQCHGPAGDGDGVIPARGFPQPPAFAGLAMTPERIVDVITHGYGVMYPHADRVAPADRWAIAAYIQALQLSQAAPLAELTPEDRQRLEATGGR